MLATHRKIVDDDIVMWLATYGRALFGQWIFFDHCSVNAKYQFCRHINFPVVTSNLFNS
jgi:hypothetical protein